MNPLVTLIGKPWAVPCDPPNSFDCWELVRHVRSLNGIDTPSVVNRDLRKPSSRQHFTAPPKGWRELTIPTPYCVVRIGLTHVGVWLGQDQIIHAQAGSGVCVSRPEHLFEDDITYWEYRHGD